MPHDTPKLSVRRWQAINELYAVIVIHWHTSKNTDKEHVLAYTNRHWLYTKLWKKI